MPTTREKPTLTRQWLTPPEVSQIVGVHALTIIGWIRSGKLSAIDTTSADATKPRFRVHRDALDRLLSELAVTPSRKEKK